MNAPRKLSWLAASLSLALLATPPALAGEKGGNGGNGIIQNRKVYVLDLVENGLEKTTYAPAADPKRVVLVDRLARKLDPADYPLDLIAAKLREIYDLDQGLAVSLTQAIEHYEWVLLDRALNDTNDDDSDITQNPGEHVQLASRSERSVRIDARFWRRLPPTHQAALVIHEVVYAQIAPSRYEKKGREYFSQSSRLTREVVGYLFRNDLRQESWDALNDRFGKYLVLTPKVSERWSNGYIDWNWGYINVSLTYGAWPNVQEEALGVNRPARGESIESALQTARPALTAACKKTLERANAWPDPRIHGSVEVGCLDCAVVMHFQEFWKNESSQSSCLKVTRREGEQFASEGLTFPAAVTVDSCVQQLNALVRTAYKKEWVAPAGFED